MLDIVRKVGTVAPLDIVRVVGKVGDSPSPDQKKKDYSLLSDIEEGLQTIPVAAVHGTLKTGASALQLTGLDNLIGKEEVEEFRKKHKEIQDEANKDSEEQGAGYITRTGNVLGEAAPLMAAGAAAGAAAPLVGVGAGAAGFGAMVAGIGVQEAANVYSQDMEAKKNLGYTEDEAETGARLKGAAGGLLAAGLTTVMGPTGVEAITSGTIPLTVKGLSKEIAKGTLKEIPEEVFTELGERLTDKLDIDKNTPWDQYLKDLGGDLKETAIIAAMSGGMTEAAVKGTRYAESKLRPEYAKLHNDVINSYADLAKKTEEYESEFKKSKQGASVQDHFDVVDQEVQNHAWRKQRLNEEGDRLRSEIARAEEDAQRNTSEESKAKSSEKIQDLKDQLAKLPSKLAENDKSLDDTLNIVSQNPESKKFVDHFRSGGSLSDVSIENELVSIKQKPQATQTQASTVQQPIQKPVSTKKNGRTILEMPSVEPAQEAKVPEPTAPEPTKTEEVLSPNEKKVLLKEKSKLNKARADVEAAREAFVKHSKALKRYNFTNWIKESGLEGKVVVVDESAPQVVKDNAANTKAMATDGKVYINPDNIRDTDDLKQIVNHEGVHVGLRSILKNPVVEKKFTTAVLQLLDGKIADSLAKRYGYGDFKRMCSEYAKKYGVKDSESFRRRVMAEELLALYAQHLLKGGSDVSKGLWSRVKDVVVNTIDRVIHGYSSNVLSDAQIQEILVKDNLTLDDVMNVIKKATVNFNRSQLEKTSHTQAPKVLLSPEQMQDLEGSVVRIAQNAANKIGDQRNVGGSFEDIASVLRAKLYEMASDPNVVNNKEVKNPVAFINRAIHNLALTIEGQSSKMSEKLIETEATNLSPEEVEAGASSVIDSSEGDTLSPVQDIDRSERAAAIEKSLDEIPLEGKLPMSMLLDGYSLKDISKETKIPIDKLQERLLEWGKDFAERMRQNGFDPRDEIIRFSLVGEYNNTDLPFDYMNLVIGSGVKPDQAGFDFVRYSIMPSFIGESFDFTKDLWNTFIVRHGNAPQDIKNAFREYKYSKNWNGKVAEAMRLLLSQGKDTDILPHFGVDKATMSKYGKDLYAALTGEGSISKLPPSMFPIYTYIRREIINLGQRAVEAGLLEKDVFEFRKGRYVKKYNYKHVPTNFLTDTINRFARRIFGAKKIGDNFNKLSTSDAYLIENRRKSKDQFTNRNPETNELFTNAAMRDLVYDKMIEDDVVSQFSEYVKSLSPQELAQSGLMGLVVYSQKTMPDGKVVNSKEIDADGVRSLVVDALKKDKDIPNKYINKARSMRKVSEKTIIKIDPSSMNERLSGFEIDTPAYTIPRMLFQMNNDIESANFFATVAANPAMKEMITDSKEFAQQEGWVQLIGGYGKLEGKYVSRMLHDIIKDVKDAGPRMWDWVRTITSTWKMGFTVLSSATQVRNVLGNAMLFSGIASNHVLDPSNWGYYREAFKTILNPSSDGLYKELYIKGLLGTDYVSLDIQDLSAEILKDMDNPEVNPIAKMFENFDRITKIPTLAKKATELASAMYRFSDDIFKVATYIKFKEKYSKINPDKAAEMAGDHVRRYFPFYDHLPNNWVKNVFTTVFPFGSFMYESTRIFCNTLRFCNASDEGRKAIAYLIALMVGIPALNNVFASMFTSDQDTTGWGSEKDDTLRSLRGNLKNLASWMPNNSMFSLFLPIKIGGSFVQWDLGNILPLGLYGLLFDARDIERDHQNAAQSVLSWIGQQNPIFGSTIGIIANKDLFTGRPIMHTDMEMSEKGFALGSFLARKFLPPWMPPYGSQWQNTMGVTYDLLQQNSPKGMAEFLDSVRSVRAGGQYVTGLKANKISPSSLEERVRSLDAVRSTVGIDLHKAELNLRDYVDLYQKAADIRKTPSTTGDTTPISRAKAKIYSGLLNKDQYLVNEGYKELVERNPLEYTADDIAKIIKDRDPIGQLSTDQQSGFYAFMMMNGNLSRIQAYLSTRLRIQEILDQEGSLTVDALKMIAEAGAGVHGKLTIKAQENPLLAPKPAILN